MLNSTSYLIHHEARRFMVIRFLKTAESLDSSYGKWLAYLLLSNLNIFVPDSMKVVIHNIEPDENRNFDAWYKEVNPLTHKFTTRREFIPHFIAMRDASNDLLSETDLLAEERVLIIMFMSLIGQYCAGKLHPVSMSRKFRLIRLLQAN